MKFLVIAVLAVIFMSCNSTSSTVDKGSAKKNDKSVKLTDERAKYSDEKFWETLPAVKAPKKTPFTKGVNFTGWFESFSAQSIPFTKYGEKDFADVKSMGVDVIRLPVRMHSMTGPAPDYTLDPLLLKFLDMAVNWAEKYKIYIIIDNHSFDPVRPTVGDIDKILLPVWAQIAGHFKNRSDYVLYEILNEPHGISDARWGEIQGLAVKEIRKYDQKHAIIVGGTDFNSIRKLSALPHYSDTNLIYTFHFYDPHIFTHQGATWGEPSLEKLENVPFPCFVEGKARHMPRTPSNLTGTWVEGALSNYGRDADYKSLNATLERVSKFAAERDVPVFCGEFGVFMINSKNEDRVLWYEFISKSLDRRNISRTSWDYYGGFGIFNYESGEFNYDLNVDVVLAMGFNPPEQKIRLNEALSEGFIIYDDYPDNRYVTAGNWGEKTDFSLYDTNSARGEYAVRWKNARQYNAFNFTFNRLKCDFSKLVEQGFFLEFKARTDANVRFDARFLNGENQSSIPWRMRYTIDEKNLPPDGKWHTIRILLSEMSEQGAWLNSKQQWINPRNEFSWGDIRALEFVSEYNDLTGCTIWFDDIRIVK